MPSCPSSSPRLDFCWAAAWAFLHTTRYGFIYFGVVEIHYTFLAVVFPFALIVYYLVWKYLIGFCNRVAGIAE